MLTHAEMLKKLEEARTEVHEMYNEQITKIVNGYYPEGLEDFNPGNNPTFDAELLHRLIDERLKQYQNFTQRIEQYKSLTE